MESSNTLMTAQIHFIEGQLSLIRIPLKHYESYVQPLLQLLHPAYANQGTDDPTQNNPWANQHPFLNISISPIECSVVCSKELAQEYFVPVVARLRKTPSSDEATISPEDMVVISVEGEGLEAGQRVLELTTPLAMAGISIFFITTYFSDYILVPIKSRGQVIRALEERGFAFEQSAEAYVNVAAHHRNTSSASSFDYKPPITPPPTTVNELQLKTFSLLKKSNIIPLVHRDIRLVHCAGRRESPNSHSSQELGLQIGVMKSIIHPPRFFSLTLTESEAASLLLQTHTLAFFGSDDVLLGSKTECLIPITLNFEPLPFEATGIVCGVASKLVGGGDGNAGDAIEMSYLSTARAGTVMIDESNVERAVEVLNAGECSFDVL